jgi:uncharacterized iron-regulated membrane protein
VSDPPTSVVVKAEPSTPIAVVFPASRIVFLDQYSGAVLGEGSKGTRDFFRTVTDLHRWIAASGDNRAVGRAVTGAANLGFLFIVISGLYLWFPRTWTKAQFRNVAWFRRGSTSRARDFNWHNVIGVWCFAPLFVIVLSGVVISYTWAGNLVYRLAGEEPPPPRPAAPPNAGPAKISTAGIDSLLQAAVNQVPDWRTISVSLPPTADSPVTFNIDTGTGGQPQHRSQLTLDRVTGDPIKWEPFASYSTGRKARSYLRFAHTGEVLGVVGQTIAGVVSLGATVLVWTGLALAWRRLRAWTKRTAGTRSAIAAIPQTDSSNP